MPFESIIPFEKLYQASLKEASRKKPVFFVHKYFARRITANFRLALLDYLNRDPDADIYDLFYNSSSNLGNGITVLDPFMGGGTTVLESLRFGCNVIGNDLQPLSYFVTKALVEPLDSGKLKAAVKNLEKTAGAKIKAMYKTTCPDCGRAADVMYAFHVKKSAQSLADHCHQFFSSFVIALKGNEFTIVCPRCGKLHKTTFSNGPFTCECGWVLNTPKDSYVKQGVYECPICHEKKALSDYVGDGCYPFATDIIAIEYHCPHCNSHDYKAPDADDIALYNNVCDEYESVREQLPIPYQKIPEGYNTNQIRNHGYESFSDLFNKRQLFALGVLLSEINKIDDASIQFWLQVAFSGMLEMNNMFCRYQANAFKICNIFFNHAYVPIAMPVENCVWGAKLGTGTFIKTVEKVIRGKSFNNAMYDIAVKRMQNGSYDSVKVSSQDRVSAQCAPSIEKLSASSPFLSCCDSKNLAFIPDGTVDLVLTDPPYGANVMYSELIDFFHCWNHMSTRAKEFGFESPLSPKSEEILVNEVAHKDFEYYTAGITKVFSECFKKTKKDGWLVFSFHDKSFDSWLSVLRSIYASGFMLSKTYPVQSETRTGAHTSGKNSIGIDMMLICKKAAQEQPIITQDTLVSVVSNTIEDVRVFLDKLNSVNAELTLPDIENMVIASAFKNCQNYRVYDEVINPELIKAITDLLADLPHELSNMVVTDKRTGWWSKLFAEKWNT